MNLEVMVAIGKETITIVEALRERGRPERQERQSREFERQWPNGLAN